MRENIVEEKSFEFAVRIVKLCRYLEEKKEFVISKQLLRCGTSIGANIAEAQFGQSKADFRTKMQIALKEANETRYWLRLLCATEFLEQKQYKSMRKDVDDVISLLAAICKTAEQD